MQRAEKFLAGKGRKIVGWDEILEGGISETATVMSWRGSAGGIEAAKKGNHVIMAPNSHCYLDYYQTDKTETEPKSIGGHLPIEKVYSLDPYEGLNADEQQYILGVQGNLSRPNSSANSTMPNTCCCRAWRRWPKWAGRTTIRISTVSRNAKLRWPGCTTLTGTSMPNTCSPPTVRPRTRQNKKPVTAALQSDTELEQKSDAGIRIAFFAASRQLDSSSTDKTENRRIGFYLRKLKRG